MALLSSYADANDYRLFNGRVSQDEDALLTEWLPGISRVAEKRARVAPGGFNSHTGTYVFDGSGTDTLYLRDASGLGYFLQSITANSLKIDTDRDGSFDDYTWDLDDAWVVGLPPNAEAQSEPYKALRILPITTAPRTVFPSDKQCIEITGTWGWAAVPFGIKSRVVGIARELLDAHRAGARMGGVSVEDMIDRIPAARGMMSLLEREYSRYVPKARAV